jgi:high-affinity iron transporter
METSTVSPKDLGSSDALDHRSTSRDDQAMVRWSLAGLASLLLAATVIAAPTARPSADVLKRGKELYEVEVGCVACHGLTGEGNGPVAFALKPPPRNFVKDPFKAGDSPDQVFHTITNGLADTRMVGYPQVKEADRWALTYYVLSFRPQR